MKAPRVLDLGRDLDQDRLTRLLEVGRQLVSERDLEAVLSRVLATAQELTMARYAALGVLDEKREELERFLTLGIDDETRAAIGPLPRGRGVLGELIAHPEPLRLAEIGAHPRSYGFPKNHPQMTSFLGAPVIIRGEAYGNIYLADKEGRTEFDEDDERTLVALAGYAAIGIDNARLYAGLQRRGRELERVVKGLEANVETTRTLEDETDPARVLELIAKRGRALLDARTFLVLLPRDGALVVVEAAGEELGLRDATVAAERSLPGDVLREDRTERISDLSSRVGLGLGGLAETATSGMLAPLAFRGRPHGVLIALDRLDGEPFEPDDELLLTAFAAGAGTALGRAQMVETEKLHLSIDSTEGERRRWARELHDQTLQDLGALKVMLEAAALGDPKGPAAAVLERAIAHVDRGITDLQGLITELRPASLDELGLRPALMALAQRVRATSRLEVDLDIGLRDEGDGGRLAPELENTIYRLVQEALTNTLKHARAERVGIRATEASGRVTLVISDDGSGFNPAERRRGFGLVGMAERVSLADGQMTIDSRPGAGTTVRIELPASRQSIAPDEADASTTAA
jgi:signal transduction histidine kinase